MRRRTQTPEEEEAGLIRLGEIYQSIDSPCAEIYLRIKTDDGIIAYVFADPETLWSRILKHCTKAIPIEECDED